MKRMVMHPNKHTQQVHELVTIDTVAAASVYDFESPDSASIYIHFCIAIT